MGNNDNIRIRCDDPQNYNDWYALKSQVDASMSNEEFVEKIAGYFNDDDSRIGDLRRVGEPPGEFRGPTDQR